MLFGNTQRCTPLSLIIGEVDPNQQQPVEGVPPPVKTTDIPCPSCGNAAIGGMYLFPLSLTNLDRAVELRKKCARAAAKASSAAAMNANGKRQRELDDNFHEVQAESSYLLLSHTRTSLTSTMSMDTDLHRTGRWTNEEISFVDFLLGAFDRRTLPLPHGVKLNEFLGDVLLCKSSRLTKKMKNARLSTRSYELSPPMPNSPGLDCAMMSSLQEKFLQSVSSEPTQLELLFNITKLWRTHFSNLCLQVGYNFLEAGDWINSLEAMERRASEAEESIRKARRKRMGLALKTDVRSSNPGVFFANVPVEGRDRAPKPQQPAGADNHAPQMPHSVSFTTSNEKQSVSSDDSGEDADFISHMLELSNQPGLDGQRNRLMSIDLAMGLDDFVDPPAASSETQVAKKSSHYQENGPFLREVVRFLEDNDLPFVHVDIWVPSFLSKSQEGASAHGSTGGDDQQLRLFHAGYATRSDINQSVAMQFNEFGEYSTKFSFAPGVGLPGRVFSEGVPIWSKRVDRADPKLFERAGGARIYGVKTVLSIPLNSSIGKLVVCLYTTTDLDQNDALVEKCLDELAQYEPEPRWRLVVEMGAKKRRTGSVRNGACGPSATSMAPAVNERDFDFSKCFDENDGLSLGGQKASSSGPPAPASEDSVREEEQRIATLLGEYMPLSQQAPHPSGGEPTSSSTVAPELLTDLMQLRLLLLKPRSRRPSNDNDLLDVLRESFQGYSSGNRRSGPELATLLVNDWRFLKSNAAGGGGVGTLGKPRTSSVASTNSAHQCHVMDAPSYSTYRASGAPVQLPNSLNYRQPSTITDSTVSLESMKSHNGENRRISVTSEIPDSP